MMSDIYMHLVKITSVITLILCSINSLAQEYHTYGLLTSTHKDKMSGECEIFRWTGKSKGPVQEVFRNKLKFRIDNSKYGEKYEFAECEVDIPINVFKKRYKFCFLVSIFHGEKDTRNSSCSFYYPAKNSNLNPGFQWSWKVRHHKNEKRHLANPLQCSFTCIPK